MTISDSHTSAFTLPSPRKMQPQEQQQQGQSSCEVGGGGPSTTSTTPLHSSTYEEFDNRNKSNNNSSRHDRSPSLPWLVEFWSSSFFRAPELVFDQLCSCSSAVDHTTVYDISHTNTMNSNTSNSIFSNNSSKNKKTTYFDDTILRSEPKVDRSPTKISPTRWEDLRSVVASHGDYTIQDYCDFYDKAVESMPSEKKEEFNGIANMNSRYPTKNITKNITKSLADESKDEDDLDIDMDDAESLRDDVPLSPIASGIRASKSHSGRDLNTCHSFDQYIETSRFLCLSPEVLSTPTATAAPPLSPPTTRLPDRRRSRQATLQLSPRTLGFHRLTSNHNNANNNPPSPAHSRADTYTTISLSQSYAEEFDEDSEDMVRSRSFIEDGRSFFLATESLNVAHSDPSKSPFRRLRPRTTLSNDDNGHEDEKKEDLEAPSTPPRRMSRKRANVSNNDDAYRCLVRMSPDNYQHGKEIDHDNSEYCLWDDVVKFPTSPTIQGEEQSLLSSVSSSLLLPLHPHQRIMTPLLDDFHHFDFEGAAANADHSGYSCFRKEPLRRRIL